MEQSTEESITRDAYVEILSYIKDNREAQLQLILQNECAVKEDIKRLKTMQRETS